MRRREAGRGAAPAGLVATRHSGGIGAPPGTTTSPCQELADRPAIAGTGKRGPVPNKRCNWRAARRPPWSQRIAATIGLRLSARHPLGSEPEATAL
jgi:hypothetical protein